jgi:diaminopimelate epimerase
MEVSFVKMEGAGNDYVYIDEMKNGYDLPFEDLAKRISDRHLGVGSDGLVIMMRGKKQGFGMRMFNADGSEAEMCGNAIRCVAKYLYDTGYVKTKQLSIETLAGAKQLTIVEAADSRGTSWVRVDMGTPILRGREIPVKVDREPVTGIEVAGYHGTAVSMGNPHFVVFVDRITDKQVLEHGPKIENDPLFPNRTNVEFVHVLDRDNIEMRVWERGSGETLACGTGACASAVAAILENRTSRDVSVAVLGGVLRIFWDEAENRVYLTGPAREVFRGIYFYER